MTACAKTRNFFLTGTSTQFEKVLGLYEQALRLKAENKSSKPENIIKLDTWYQNDLPKKIKSRGKDPHLTHEELVQTIKWKLARGKFRPNLSNLVQMNTPRVVMNETKKAFRGIYKRRDLKAATTVLCNLKGVGPAMASAVLAAGAPQVAPFMADECLLSMPEVDCLDYTMKEYMRFVELINETVERLNQQGGSWTPHKVELTIWTHYITNDLKPELLIDLLDSSNSNGTTEAKNSEEEEAAQPIKNGNNDSEESNMSNMSTAEESNEATSTAEDSNPAPSTEQPQPQTSNGNSTEASSANTATAEPSVSQNGESASPKTDSNGTSSSETPKAVENGSSNGNQTASESVSSNPSTEAAPASTNSATAESETTASETKAEITDDAQALSTKATTPEETSSQPAEENSNSSSSSISQKRSILNDNEGEATTEEEPVAKKLKTAEVMTA